MDYVTVVHVPGSYFRGLRHNPYGVVFELCGGVRAVRLAFLKLCGGRLVSKCLMYKRYTWVKEGRLRELRYLCRVVERRGGRVLCEVWWASGSGERWWLGTVVATGWRRARIVAESLKVEPVVVPEHLARKYPPLIRGDRREVVFASRVLNAFLSKHGSSL